MNNLSECINYGSVNDISSIYFIDGENLSFNTITAHVSPHASGIIIVNPRQRSLYQKVKDQYANLCIVKNSSDKSQAADFILSSIIGIYIHVSQYCANIKIVSNDKGFDALVKYWKSEKLSIERLNTNISANIKTQGLSR